MKKAFALLLILALCVPLLAACGGNEAPAESAGGAPAGQSEPAQQQDAYYSQDLDITNSTGVDILQLYISPAGAESWGEDLLGGGVFPAGGTGTFTTELIGTVNARWDIAIVDADGDTVVFTDVDFSSNAGLDLHWGSDGQTPTVAYLGATSGGSTGGTAGTAGAAEEQYYSQDLDITNSTGVDILQLYISPAGTESWGEDLLGGGVFPAGSTGTFTTELIGTAGARWDIAIVDADGDTVTFAGVDFSSSTALNLSWGSDGQTPTVTMR